MLTGDRSKLQQAYDGGLKTNVVWMTKNMRWTRPSKALHTKGVTFLQRGRSTATTRSTRSTIS